LVIRNLNHSLGGIKNILARRIIIYVPESLKIFCLEELQHTVPETIRNILAGRINIQSLCSPTLIIFWL
jgi:hypothetical protein